MSDSDVAPLRTVADYQFGRAAGVALFPSDESFRVTTSASGRIRQVATADGDRLVSRGLDGRLTLGLTGGRRLVDAFRSPACRVVVGDESEPYVRDGRNVFAKFVQDVDPDVRSRDEVAVTHSDGHVVAVGRAELDAESMADFETGVAVKIRAGAGLDDDPNPVDSAGE